MDVSVEQAEGGMCRIAVEGEMTIYTALELKEKLLPPLAQCQALEIHLAGVGDIDSAGLQLLILVKNEAQLQGKALSLTGHSPAVLDLLDLCDLEGYFGDSVLIDTWK